jgi:uncharacterized membrane protein
MSSASFEGEPMRLWNTFLKGLAAVLPVTLTLYLVYWLGTKAESFLGGLLEHVLPAGWYRPGLGLVVGFAVVLTTGVLVNAYVVRRIFKLGEALLARIPVVKTIFGTFQDITRFLPAGERRDLQRVVLWRFANARLIGFVTEEHVSPRLAGEVASQLVAVYFPMSYQLGGYTLYLSRAELEPTQLTVEEGMRLALIGGISHAAAAPP